MAALTKDRATPYRDGIEIDALGEEVVNLIAADGWKPRSETQKKQRKGKAA